MKALERFISAIVAAVIQYPLICCLLFFAATAASLWQLQHLSFDSSAESFLKPDDPERIEYLQFEDKYGLSAYFMVLVRDEALFTEAGITRLRQLHNALAQQVHNIERVESLINARFISSVDDDILIEEFWADNHFTAEQLLIKKQQALATPYYIGRFINPSATATTVLLQISQVDQYGERISVAQIQRSMDEIDAVLQASQAQYSTPLLLGGSPVIGAELTRVTQREMLMFSALATLVVVIMLYAVFRCVSAVILPLLCMFASIVMVLSVMAAFKFSVQVSSVILPSFLMAVGVADAVHFLRAFYPSFNQSGDIKASVMYAIGHTGVAMFFSTLTTSVGLLSFAWSNVTSIASFGIFSSLGVWLAFGLTVVCLPAMLVLLPLKPRQMVQKNTKVALENFVHRYVLWLQRYALSITLIGTLTLVVALFYANKLHFSLNMLEWFHSSHPVRMANTQIEQQMNGSMQVELLVRRSDIEAEPLTLAHLQTVDTWLEGLISSPPAGISISSVVSVLGLLKEATAVLQPEVGYQLPDNDELLAQELLLLQFDSNNSLAKLMDNAMREVRISLAIPWQDSLQYNVLLNEINRSFYQHTENLQLQQTGMATLSNKAFDQMTQSMLKSYVLATLVILLLLMLLTKKAGVGLAAMILPNVLPVVVVLAIMYWFSVPLDMFTMLIGSIAIGLIVDDTIHLLYTFQRNIKESGVSSTAMIRSLLTTGRALVATTIVLSAAFLIYCFSSLSNLMAFGYLTALCIILALVADLLLLPAILLLLYKKHNKS